VPYHFPPAIEKELASFDGDNPALVTDEIKLCRLLIRRAIEANSPGLAATLMSTIAKLSSVQVSNAARIGQMLDRSELTRMGQRLSAVLVERLSGLPGYEQLADTLLSDMQKVFSERATLTVESAEPAEHREPDVLPLGHLAP
jgi:hypothetical protein